MKKKTPVINLTFYLYFIILCFVGKCLAGNNDISFHFIRGKEADFSSPEEGGEDDLFHWRLSFDPMAVKTLIGWRFNLSETRSNE